MEHLDLIQALADNYPLEDLLEQNDIEAYVVVKYLVDEGLIDLEDYYFKDTEDDTND
jgi:S-adenosylmethionine synthetase